MTGRLECLPHWLDVSSSGRLGSVNKEPRLNPTAMGSSEGCGWPRDVDEKSRSAGCGSRRNETAWRRMGLSGKAPSPHLSTAPEARRVLVHTVHTVGNLAWDHGPSGGGPLLGTVRCSPKMEALWKQLRDVGTVPVISVWSVHKLQLVRCASQFGPAYRFATTTNAAPTPG